VLHNNHSIIRSLSNQLCNQYHLTIWSERWTIPQWY